MPKAMTLKAAPDGEDRCMSVNAGMEAVAKVFNVSNNEMQQSYEQEKQKVQALAGKTQKENGLGNAIKLMNAVMK